MRTHKSKPQKITPPMRELAASRIKSAALEIAKDHDYERGWQAAAARSLGLSPQTLHLIVKRPHATVGTRVIEQVCRKIGCSTSDLMEE